jgi:hypothetical protein
MSENVPCDDINIRSWNAMPISMRVKDFCRHCDFLCDHGKELIEELKKLPQCAEVEMDGESMAYDVDPDTYYDAEEAMYASYHGEPEGPDDYESMLEREFERKIAEREEAYYGRDGGF